MQKKHRLLDGGEISMTEQTDIRYVHHDKPLVKIMYNLLYYQELIIQHNNIKSWPPFFTIGLKG